MSGDDYLNGMSNLGLDQLVNVDTRVQGGSSTLIDYILFRSSLNYANKILVFD